MYDNVCLEKHWTAALNCISKQLIWLYFRFFSEAKIRPYSLNEFLAKFKDDDDIKIVWVNISILFKFGTILTGKKYGNHFGIPSISQWILGRTILQFEITYNIPIARLFFFFWNLAKIITRNMSQSSIKLLTLTITKKESNRKPMTCGMLWIKLFDEQLKNCKYIEFYSYSYEYMDGSFTS